MYYKSFVNHVFHRCQLNAVQSIRVGTWLVTTSCLFCIWVMVVRLRNLFPDRSGRGAVYTAYTLLRLCSVYFKYTASRRKYICSVIVYCLRRAYTAPCSIPQCQCSVLRTVRLQCMVPLIVQSCAIS